MLCLFVTNKRINFVGDAPSPAHSHELRPHDTGITPPSDERGEKGRAGGGGGLTRSGRGEGNFLAAMKKR